LKTSSSNNYSNNNKLLVPSSPIISLSNNGSNGTHNNKEIENGLDFILKHFDQDRLFPRTIMTKNLGYQKEVFSKEEALQFFKESDFIDCRINAFPSYTEYKGLQRYPPDLIFIDIDKKDFKTSIGFEVALSTTLKNIKVKLGNNNNDIYPTVLKTGRGYHIILPI
jgi:threonyl-tRNA synthetase